MARLKLHENAGKTIIADVTECFPRQSESHFSLRSKRFRGVQERRNTKERYFARAKFGREQNKKEGVGQGKEGNAVSFLPSPPLLPSFFAR